MNNKSKDRFEITELFMVKADMHRKFIGEINRHTDVDGNKFVTGKVFVQEGQIWSMADNQYELGRFLDDICILKVDYNIHTIVGKTSEITGTSIFLN